MKELLTFILSQIVSRSETLSIEERPQGDNSYLYLIEVAPEDMGKVIGKDGKIIRAIRLLAKVWAVKHNQFVAVELVDAGAKS